MKKLTITLIFLIALLFSNQADAQVRFGVKGGVNVSKISFSQSTFSGKNRTGFFIGPTVKFTLPIVGLGLDASALFDQRATEIAGGTAASGETTVKQRSVVLPINLRYGWGLSSLANVFIFAGPEFAFNVGDSNFEWTDAQTYKNVFQLKKSTTNVNLGAGFTLFDHLQITGNYNVAIGKTGEIKIHKLDQQVTDAIDMAHTNTWRLSATYFF